MTSGRSHRTCSASVGQTPVSPCTWPASLNFSSIVTAAAGCRNLPNRVPVFAKPQDGNSIRNASSAWKTASEVIFVDVSFVHEERRAEDDLAAADVDPSETARLECRRSRRERLTHELRGRENRQISQVARVPQDHGLNDAAVHVRFVDVRQRQSDDANVSG